MQLPQEYRRLDYYSEQQGLGHYFGHCPSCHVHYSKFKKDRQSMYNVTQRRVRVTIVAVQQVGEWHIPSVYP